MIIISKPTVDSPMAFSSLTGAVIFKDAFSRTGTGKLYFIKMNDKGTYFFAKKSDYPDLFPPINKN